MKQGAQAYAVTAGALILTIVGLLMLSSASSVVAYENFGDSYYYMKRQIFFGIIPAIAVAFFLWNIPKKRFWSMVPLAACISLVLLIIVFIPGIGVQSNGAYRWIRIGSLSLQPSEVAKFLSILFASFWLAERVQGQRGQWSEHLKWYLLGLSATVGLVVLEPDMGTALVIVVILLSILFAAQVPLKYLLRIMLSGIIAVTLIVAVSPYRRERVRTFIYPTHDELGSGYHINQALVAIGSGGLWGKGYGHSIQKFRYLPEVMSDSLFAIMAEEIGLVGVLGVLGLYVWFICSLLQSARRSNELLHRLVFTGVASWIGIQVLLNIMANIGLVPFTGVPLPLMGYGGTALAMNIIAIVFVVKCLHESPMIHDSSVWRTRGVALRSSVRPA